MPIEASFVEMLSSLGGTMAAEPNTMIDNRTGITVY